MWYMCTMEYSSVFKRNEGISLVAMLVDPGIIKPSKTSLTKKDISCDTTYMWNLKKNYLIIKEKHGALWTGLIPQSSSQMTSVLCFHQHENKPQAEYVHRGSTPYEEKVETHSHYRRMVSCYQNIILGCFRWTARSFSPSLSLWVRDKGTGNRPIGLLLTVKWGSVA